MMMNWKLFFACFNGPSVYRKYREFGMPAGQESSNGMYQTNILEDHCGFVVKFIESCWTLTMYTSPFLVFYAATRRSVLGLSPEFALKLALGMACVYGGAYLGRGLGRAMNKDYWAFLRILTAAMESKENANVANMRNVRRYDFDFRYWPVNYHWRETDKYGEPVAPRLHVKTDAKSESSGGIGKMLFEGLSFIAAHTVARRLAYPGTMAFLQKAVAPALEQGRTKLVEQMNGHRFKLQTRTGNEIDTMFVDRRNNLQFPKGNILVITCEGNAGFYEAGSAATPLEGKYSVLMWNHPGFGGSTGVPWPAEESAAVDVVVQFAVNQLGWEEGEIVLYGWSIGGYTATWAAMNYRSIRALVLDATFDDVVPLAVNTMPRSWSTLVTHTVRTYLNLAIGKQLKQYNGPVILVRRSRDEVMAATSDSADGDLLATMRKVNRANNLLKDLLASRYPNVFRDDVDDIVDQWLASTIPQRNTLLTMYRVDENEWRRTLREFIKQNNERGDLFPVLIGDNYDLDSRRKLALYLASKYLIDFDSTHCTPLIVDSFIIPSHPWQAV